ncbi:MAG: enoyl-CoA hydratase-related protein, partial [Nitriliruptorales bacterium]|nr:enoyl-CoA hydratase-related protein [Nitriliruptorales bacterium]
WAADTANFGLVEAVIGATPFGGGTARLAARAGLGRAAEAVYTARIYDAQTMLDWGVVQRVVPADDLLAKSRALADQLAAGPTRAHQATSAVLNAWAEGGVALADATLRQVAPPVLVTEDLQAGVESLLADGPGQATFVGR